MAKRIIILERAEGNPINYTVAFWLVVPVARRSYYAAVGKKSAWRGASQAEHDAIAAGEVLEVIDSCSQMATATEGEVALDLEARWAQKQSVLTLALLLYRYGTYWDGISWTVVTA